MLKLNQDMFAQILKIALPALGGFAAIIAFEMTDVYWVGKVNYKAVAAIGAASFFQWGIFGLMMITGIGAQTLIAQAIGAGLKTKQIELARQAFWGSVILSVVFIVIFWPISRSAFDLMGLDTETAWLATRYLKVWLLGLPFIYLYYLQGMIFNAHGDNKISNLILVVSLIINMALDPLLIFGMGPFPELGITGAAIATVAGQFFGFLLRSYYLLKKSYIPAISQLGAKDLHYLRPMIKIGFPAAMGHLVWTMIFPVLSTILNQFGMAPLAGMNISQRLEGFPYFIGEALSIAMCTLIGKAYGAKNEEQVSMIVRHGQVLVILALTPISLAFVFFPQTLAGLLNDDPDVLFHASNYLMIVGMTEIFLGIEMLYEGIYNGLGKASTQMWIRVPLTLIRYPLGLFLAMNMNLGPLGVWIAITISTALKGFSLPLIFHYFVSIKSDSKNFWSFFRRRI